MMVEIRAESFMLEYAQNTPIFSRISVAVHLHVCFRNVPGCVSGMFRDMFPQCAGLCSWSVPGRVSEVFRVGFQSANRYAARPGQSNDTFFAIFSS